MVDLSNSHFKEECCMEFSSPMQSYSRSESFLHCVTNPTTCSTTSTGTRTGSTSKSTFNDSNSPTSTSTSTTGISSTNTNTGYETRMATECNSMKISIDDESGRMKLVTRPFRQQDDKCCIAYTYLPLSGLLPQGNGFLEAYVVTMPTGINDSTHRSVMSQTENSNSAASISIAAMGGADASKTIVSTSASASASASASTHHSMAGAGTGSGAGAGGINSSHVGAGGGANQNPMEEAKISTMDRSQHKLQEYLVVITGYLNPPTNSENNNDTRTTAHAHGRGRGHAHAHGHDKKGEIPVSGGRNRQRKKPKDENETNFYQTMSVLARPSTIELCHIESSQSDLLLGGSSGLSKFALFLGSGTEVKMYTLSSIHEDLDPVAVDGKERFRIEPTTISNHLHSHSQTNDIANVSARAPSMDFISLLLQHRTPLTENQSPLLFASPITAMSSFTQLNHLDRPYMNGLSIGCQDGSICIITFLSKFSLKGEEQDDDDDDDGGGGHLKDDAYSFELLNISEYVLDGSITSLSFQCRQDDIHKTERLVLFAGSVCGFACSFLQKSMDSTAFEDPCPIVEGLWDAKLEDEDSVLTICEFQCGAVKGGRAIALGLYSGRVLLFTDCKFNPAQEYEIDSHSQSHSHSQSDLDDSVHGFESYPRYECFWHCNLPYPVHDIRASASPNELFPEMVICTRRTLHLFRSTPEFIAEATLERIEDLIAKYKKNDFNMSINEHEVFVDTTHVNLKF